MELKEMTYKEALKLALKEMMTADGDVVIFGEDVRQGFSKPWSNYFKL